MAPAQLGDFAGQVGEQRVDVGLAERRGRRADQHRAGPEPLDLEAEAGELVGRAFEPVAIGFVELDHFGDQQRLARDRRRRSRAARIRSSTSRSCAACWSTMTSPSSASATM